MKNKTHSKGFTFLLKIPAKESDLWFKVKTAAIYNNCTIGHVIIEALRKYIK